MKIEFFHIAYADHGFPSYISCQRLRQVIHIPLSSVHCYPQHGNSLLTGTPLPSQLHPLGILTLGSDPGSTQHFNPCFSRQLSALPQSPYRSPHPITPPAPGDHTSRCEQATLSSFLKPFSVLFSLPTSVPLCHPRPADALPTRQQIAITHP